MKSHAIRLRGAWQLQFPGAVAESEVTTGHDSPQQLLRKLPADCAGPLQMLRRFGRPIALPAGDRVELVIPPLDVVCRVLLNSDELGTTSPDQETRFDITGRIAARNELILVCREPSDPATPLDSDPAVLHVRLEFFPAA